MRIYFKKPTYLYNSLKIHPFTNLLRIAGIILPVLWILFFTSYGTAQVSWTPIYVDTRNRLDLWTISERGCECPNNKTSSNCACCVKPGGCLCSYNHNKCAQCGLEESCQRFCNATINSRTVASKSGLSWVQIKSPVLEGPTSCWWHLESAPGQRIEVQIHRLIAVGTFDNTTQNASLTFQYDGYGSPFKLSLTEGNVITKFELKTEPVDDLMEIELDDPLCKIILKSEYMKELFSEIEGNGLETIRFTLEPRKELRLSARGISGVMHICIPYNSQTVESFECPAPCHAYYSFNHIKHSFKAMNLSQKMALQIDSSGILSLSFSFSTEDLDSIVQLLCFPQVYEADEIDLEVAEIRDQCSLGFLQFADGDISAPTSQAIQLCAENSRFSPPVVVFGDQGIATLLLRVDGKTRGSQLLAYVSFSSADDPAVGVVPAKGGRIRSHTVCDWLYENCWSQECILASPGYPGLFPPHRRCRYFLSGNSSTEKIKVKFHSVNFPKLGLCSTHHINIWRRNASNSNNLGIPLKTLCHETELIYEINGPQALIEFKSGASVPPYMSNGFRASVQFIASSNNRQLPTNAPFPYHTVQLETTTSPSSMGKNLPDISTSLRNLGDAQEPLLGNERASYEADGVSTIACNHIFDGTQTRGNVFRLLIPKDLTIRPRSMSFGNHAPQANCPLQGRLNVNLNSEEKPSDIVQFAIFSFRFRGSNCSTIMEVYDMEEKTDRILGKLCGPHGNELKIFTSSHRIMALVIQVSRFPLNEDPPFTEFLEGAFRFHDESIEGTVKPMASCEVVYYGVTSSPVGTLFGPPDSPLLRLSTFPLVCAHSFIPGPNQSVALTLNRAGHESIVVAVPNSPKYCRSICGSSGCRCEAKHSPLDQIDHMLLMAGTVPIGCLCGYFRDILPLVFESHAPLTIVYHASQGGREFTYAVGFQFKEKVTCANFSIHPPSASRRWKEILGPEIMSNKFSQHYSYFQCTWSVSIPSSYKLTLDFISEEDEEDCNTWNLTLWSGNTPRQDYRNNNIELFSFCPNQGRNEIVVPDTVETAYIKLAGVTLRPPQFEVRWKYNDVMLDNGILAEKKLTTTNGSFCPTSDYVPLMLLIVIVFFYPFGNINFFLYRFLTSVN